VTGKDIQASHVVWDGAVDMTADDMVRAETDRSRAPALEETKDFLRDLLSDGPNPVAEVKRAARDAGLTYDTVQRAKRALRIEPRQIKGSAHAGWKWALPGGDDFDESTDDI
jgi:putative DNA primase/helicase